jgi:ABC-2 type transport system ATP-binding protein
LTTHYLDEADALADRVVIIDNGRIIADDAPDRLKADLVGDRLEITVDDAGSAPRAAALLARITPAVVERDAGTLRARVAGGPGHLPRLLRDLDLDGVKVSSAAVERATLDDVFLELTGRSLRESAVAGEPSSPDRADDLQEVSR